MNTLSSHKNNLLKQLGRVADPAQLDRLIPLLEQEIHANNLTGTAVTEALNRLYDRTDDAGLCARIKRLENRLRLKKFLGRDPLVAPAATGAEEGASLWDELRELKKVWQQATGKKNFEDEYEVLEKIGSGGMSMVYLVRRRSDGTRLAAKFLHKRFFDSQKVIRRFRRECRICLALRHEHIVRVIEAGEHDGAGFMIMEYLPLGGADQLLKDPGFSPAIAFQVAIQAAEALSVIHEQGIIHRDLKPANLLIADYLPEQEKISIKLADFGCCRDTTGEELTKVGSIMGTEQYMAPEQLQNAAGVDFRADLFSLGVLIYRLFSRKYFPVGDYPPLHRLNPALPRELDALVRWCTCHEPEKRPETAKLIRSRLEKSFSLLHQQTASSCGSPCNFG
ncbi:serine/threonine-protein kinase [Desulfomarina sp.]